ncbi:tyrosine-type recombinase/integrase [Gimesia panareensis]|uniref:tyrosine-type recombinase/integrase n=1 Tax=Gimesia panareensis TaxID=2527978 RepID=UPI0011A04E98
MRLLRNRVVLYSIPCLLYLRTLRGTQQLQKSVENSKWSVIPGWHCLRHSFISNLASHSIDQRLIDEFVGHTTEEMRRRYRHLFPEVKQAALCSVFH